MQTTDKIMCANCKTMQKPKDMTLVHDMHGTHNICKSRIGRHGLLCRDKEAK